METGDRNTVAEALRAIVLQGLRPTAIGVAALYVGFAFADGFLLAGSARIPVAVSDAAVAIILDMLFLAIVLGRIQPRHAHAWSLGFGLLVAANVTLSIALTRDPVQSMGFILLQLGASLLLLDTRSLTLLLAISDAVWLAIAYANGLGPAWIEQGTLLAAATVLAAIAHSVRLGSLTRLESLRIQDARTKEQLGRLVVAEARATQEASASRERYRLVAESTFEGICIHDGVRILDANPAFARLVGRTLAQLQGQSILDLVAPPHRHEVGQRLLLDTEEAIATELVRSDDVRIPVEFRGRPAPEGEAFVVAVRDLTSRQQAEQLDRLAGERLKEIEVLKEVNQFKTQFINTASHELRTPLTPIMLQVGVLRQPHVAGDATRTRRSVEILSRNLERLNRLVADVLDAGRIQAERLRCEQRPIDMDCLLAETVEAVRPQAEAKQLALTRRGDAELWAQADPDRIHQVVLNLLTNAIKFTPAGGHIEVEALRHAAGIRVEVRDSGEGFASEEAHRLFQPFSQLGRTVERTDSGTGLGLYISKGIVERHGGRLWGRSDGIGKGAAFGFTLPAGA